MNTQLRILITGVNGQLGYDCFLRAKEMGYQFIRGIDIDDLDLTLQSDVEAYISEYKPDVIIHCAAFTNVNKAETDKELSYKVNADATGYIAQIAQKLDCKVIYISTDYVFDGTKKEPYLPNDMKSPISIYGDSKSLGEEKIRQYLTKYFIVRTSWVFGINGHNFVKSMIDLAKSGKKEINVVNDQIGSPTYTKDLAILLCEMLESNKYGIYHANNEGYCSWAEFANEIFSLSHLKVKVNEISSFEYESLYPGQAKRPNNSRLDKSCLDDAGFARLPNWRDALKRFIDELFNNHNPKISILLAIYNPRIDWFIKLLKSLNEQDYSNYEILAINDSSSLIKNSEINELLNKYLSKTPYKLWQNSTNLGSNKTFEELIKRSNNDYVAFADQDDIWHKDKLSKSIEALLNNHNDMVCSDVRIIDELDKTISSSITKYKKRFVFFDSEQFAHLLFKNFVIGCTVTMRRDLALSAIPFIPSIVHDHLLALHAAYNGHITIIKEPLLDYRIHYGNQTSTLHNVKSRDDYYNYKIKSFDNTLTELKNRFNDRLIDDAIIWSNARKNNYKKEKHSFKNLYKMRNINRPISFFELFALRNKIIFKIALKLLKNNII